MIKTIFIGTPDFGLASLKALINDAFFDVVTVITQPDKPVGRKQILTPPPIKIEAQKHNIKMLQPENIADCRLKIENLAPDLIIVAAYAQIIPKNILNIPKYGCTLSPEEELHEPYDDEKFHCVEEEPANLMLW